MAVPTTVKIPDPITAPIPSAVKDTGPRVFFNLRSGSSESEISLSMDLQQKSWLPELSCSPALGAGRLTVGGCANGAYLLGSRARNWLVSSGHSLRNLARACARATDN